MGREVRRVPATWVHPRDAGGVLIPMGVLVMPQWAEGERTHWMMYETVTAGTPLSPALPTPEALAQWLVDRQTRLCAAAPASYTTWLGVIHGRAAGVPGCVLPTAPVNQLP
jgi:hypothetical protein